MTFATLGWPLVAAGAVVLAALVYALQRLRPQRRVVRLPAASLWAQAMRDTPVRVLGGRFRQWPAYLLILAIALLLWVAAAQPQWGPAAGRGRQIFYLDNSALLTGGGRWAAAKRALLADVRAVAADRREVLLGDAVAARLLLPGESVSLLSRRLDMVRPEARPSRFADWLPNAGDVQVRYYGGSPLRDGRVAYGYLPDPVPGNRGIVALGVEPARSGAVAKADLLVAVAAANATVSSPDDLRWTLDGRSFRPSRIEPLGEGRYLLPDIEAAGQEVGVTLVPGDGYAADDAASLRLPDRRPLRVALLAGTPATLRAAVAADASLTVVPLAQAQVAIGDSRAVAQAKLPALAIADPTAQRQAFVFAGPGEAARGDLTARLDELGLREVDAAALADALRRPIGVDLRDATERRVGIWGSVFAPDTPFVDSAAMPLLVSRSLHWLGGTPAWQSRDPAALTDRTTTLAAAGPASGMVRPLDGTGWPNLPVLALLTAALAMLGVEWWLVQRGRMA